ncbi:MAG: DUF1427 family protein [Proteobacteria bacterium]|nr:DUF1427 family protein [Pseudomonadota bacterium]
MLLCGLALGAIIGAACRWFDLPLPSPPTLTGALLVLTMTMGYVLHDPLIDFMGRM